MSNSRERIERVQRIQFKIIDFSIEGEELLHAGNKSQDERPLAIALNQLSGAAVSGVAWETWPYAYIELRDRAREVVIKHLPVIEWALRRHREDTRLSTRALCVVAGLILTTNRSQYEVGRRLIADNVAAIHEGAERLPTWGRLYRAALKTHERPLDDDKISHLTIEVWGGCDELGQYSSARAQSRENISKWISAIRKSNPYKK